MMVIAVTRMTASHGFQEKDCSFVGDSLGTVAGARGGGLPPAAWEAADSASPIFIGSGGVARFAFTLNSLPFTDSFK